MSLATDSSRDSPLRRRPLRIEAAPTPHGLAPWARWCAPTPPGFECGDDKPPRADHPVAGSITAAADAAAAGVATAGAVALDGRLMERAEAVVRPVARGGGLVIDTTAAAVGGAADATFTCAFPDAAADGAGALMVTADAGKTFTEAAETRVGGAAETAVAVGGAGLTSETATGAGAAVPPPLAVPQPPARRCATASSWGVAPAVAAATRRAQRPASA